MIPRPVIARGINRQLAPLRSHGFMKLIPPVPWIFATAVLLVGCGKPAPSLTEPESNRTLLLEPLPERTGLPNEPLFSKLAVETTGITFQNDIDLTHPLKRLYHCGFVCGGVAVGDLDGDDLPELFFASGPGTNRLYKQTAPFQFKDITESADVGGGKDWAAGVAFIDIDADSDLDIYVSNYESPNALYVNESAGVFREAAAEYGLDIVDASLMPSFCDYDNDGDLDCWLLTNRLYREGGRPQQPPIYTDQTTSKVNVKPEFAKYYGIIQADAKRMKMDEVGRPDYLLRNDGGQFVDVSKDAGTSINGFGLSATWWDYNEDGWMDIYVCNDFLDPDRLFRNNGDGTFTDVITETVNATPWASMGSDAGDINNDGRLDFVALDMAATTHYKSKMAMGEMGSMRWSLESVKPRQLMRNMCYLNTGTSRFIETAQLSGIASTDWSWAAKLADFDNDGRVDLFVSNGMARDFSNSDIPFSDEDLIGKTRWDLYEDTPTRPEQNLAFQNTDGLKFRDVSNEWGLDHTGMSHGTAYGDLDRDGDLDLVVVNLNEPVSVYRNNSAGNNTVAIRLRGKENTNGLGATVRLETESGRLHMRQVTPATGFLSSNDPEVIIGLGDEDKIKSLSVEWPDSGVDRFEDLQAGNRYIVSQQSTAKVKSGRKQSANAPLFGKSKDLNGLVHRERIFEDFIRQPLLPNKLSQLGPGLAWADVDNDGDDDMFIGGSRSLVGGVFINDGLDQNGVTKFKNPTKVPFQADVERENQGALFFDADRDGDMDLYVANGSYEYDEGDALLADTLYLNNGTGNFSQTAGAIPNFRDVSSCVVGADFDRDGDVDLFVGGRVIPGKYPLAANSRLLINAGTKRGEAHFVEAKDAMAPGLRSAGMVTGALWSDTDNDGWVDLLVTCEWGPVKFFKNHQGTLHEQTKAAGLADLLGWWNSIAGADVDHDGDIDYAVANFGLNTKYHATPKKPGLLYYGDYTGDGKACLVEAKFENDVLFPVRGKSCSTHAMPQLAERFTSFHQFATANLTEIYTPAKLDTSLKLSVTTLESGMLLNDGSGQFTFRPFPDIAQVSPGFGLCFLDANGDTHADVFMAQNFFSPQFETGPFSSGLSVLLLGDGNGNFNVVSPNKSQLLIPHDARAATTVDFNRDGWLDLAVAQNNGEFLTFRSISNDNGRTLRVRLDGGPGNPAAAGARVTVHLKSGGQIVHEIHAGSGYLSQSSPAMSISLGSQDPAKVAVRWADGQVSETSKLPGNGVLQIPHPGE